jgi:hypothetical protein
MRCLSFPSGLAVLFLVLCLGLADARHPEKKSLSGILSAEIIPGQKAGPDALGIRDIELELPLSQGTLSVRAGIPRAWERNPDFGGPVFQPPDKDDYFYPPLLQYQASCGGSCEPSAIPANIEAALRSIKESLARPNINTGDPSLDAIRARVDIFREERIEEKIWILAAGVVYPENLPRSLYVPKFVVHGFRYRAGDGFYIQTAAHGPLDRKNELLDLLIAACLATEY